jgi:hypothetical protein
MSKSAILDELPKLGHADRREILERICEIEEADLLRGAAIDPNEKAMLDRELEEYQVNPQAGADWKEVEPRLRKHIRR